MTLRTPTPLLTYQDLNVDLDELEVNIKSSPYNAIGDGIADDTAALQSAIATVFTAGGGIVYVPPGTYKITSNLVIPFGAPITLMGANWSSKLSWTTDSGVGTYAISWGPFANWVNNLYMKIENIFLQGPNNSSTIPSSITSLVGMNGVRMERKTELKGVKVEGFGGGVVMYGNHQRLWGNTIRANDYNILYETIAGGDAMVGSQFGDQSFLDNDLQGARVANVAVGDNNGIIGAVFMANQFGFAPFNWLALTGRTSGTFVSDTVIANNNFEQVGNANIYAVDANATADIWRRVTITANGTSSTSTGGPSEAFNPTYKISGIDADFNVRIANFEDVTIIGANFLSYPGAVGFFKLRQWTDCRWFAAKTLLSEMSSTARPLYTTFASGDTVGSASGFIEASGTTYLPMNPDNAFSIGDLVQVTSGANRVAKYTTGIPRGIAVETGAEVTGLERTLIAIAGPVTANVDAANSIGANKYVKPDTTHNGKVQEAASAADAPIIGVTHTASGAGVANTLILRGLS